MAKGYDDDLDRDRVNDEPRVAALSDMGDYEVAEGYPDPRGWTVRSSDGTEVGKVHDLIVDTGSMRTRYLDVRLAKDVAGATEDRDVLVPIGTARVDDDGDNVIVNGLTADRIVMLPAYDHRQLTRAQETDLRTRFTSGDAMSAGVIGAGATGGTDFYDHQHFDDRNFFGGRRGRDSIDREIPREPARDVDIRADRTANETERLTVSEEQLAVGRRMIEAGEIGVRKNVEARHVEQEVPLSREEVTVERRPIGEEIIIRRTARRDTGTIGAELR
jgi:stress response protein YsnF